MKVDLKKTLDCYAARRGVLRVLDVPPLQYLMIDGHGDPNTAPQWAAAVETLFPVAYALKFASRNELGRDHVVMPLEALWWAEDMAAFTARRDKSRWSWTAMIMVPDWVPSTMVGVAVEQTAAKGKGPALDRLRLETLREDRCVQTLHVGSYDDEGPVLAEMHERFIPDAGLRMTGRHHEVYLSDARRVEPARLRTILRQPVSEATRER
ncbi:GyrI-like domain-containing protein [Aeromicrobium sp. CTD01-1L150]|uniref:GyrI-like domain-containing protein n=1 Tax=Aeromicrobium sp. CTD01-1L150 TaxID=3341830 RepID=UPI0035C20233